MERAGHARSKLKAKVGCQLGMALLSVSKDLGGDILSGDDALLVLLEGCSSLALVVFDVLLSRSISYRRLSQLLLVSFVNNSIEML